MGKRGYTGVRHKCDECGHEWRPKKVRPGSHIYCPKCGEFHSKRAGYKIPPKEIRTRPPPKQVEERPPMEPIKPYEPRTLKKMSLNGDTLKFGGYVEESKKKGKRRKK